MYVHRDLIRIYKYTSYFFFLQSKLFCLDVKYCLFPESTLYRERPSIEPYYTIYESQSYTTSSIFSTSIHSEKSLKNLFYILLLHPDATISDTESLALILDFYGSSFFIVGDSVFE